MFDHSFGSIARFMTVFAGTSLAGIAFAQQPSEQPLNITLPDLDTSKLKLDPKVSSRSSGHRDCIFDGPGQTAMVHMEDRISISRAMKIKKGDWMFDSVSKDANGKEITHGMGRNGMGSTRDVPSDPLHPVEVRLVQWGPGPTLLSLSFPFIPGVGGLNSKAPAPEPDIVTGFHTYSRPATPEETKQGQAAGKKIYERCRQYFLGLDSPSFR